MSLGMISPPDALGSGKFGTPWARMHWAEASAGPPVGPALLGPLALPQAAITAVQVIARTAVGKTLGRTRVYISMTG